MIIFLITACPLKEVVYLDIRIETTEDSSGTIIPSRGEYSYYKGMTQKITATPSEGSVFMKWIIDGIEETNPSTIITVNKSLTVTAYFEKEKPKYSLEVLEPYGKGEISPTTGTYEYKEDSVITLRATPAVGWKFSKWQVNDEDYSSDQTTTLIMDENMKVKGFFEELSADKHTLTMLQPEGNGTVFPTSGIHVYNKNTEATLVAIPDENWRFVKWEVNNEFYSDEQAKFLEMDSDKVVKAFFLDSFSEYVLSTVVYGNGWIEIEPEKELYTRGEKVTLEAIPGKCSKFVEWTGDVTSENKRIELTMDKDKVVYAHFKKKDATPSIEIDSPKPLPEYTNRLEQEYDFSFASNNEGVNLQKITAEICSDNWTFNSEIYDNVGEGVLILSFDPEREIDCETYDATITVEDSCRNIASKGVHITIDNVLPDLEFEVGAFKIIGGTTEATLSWKATDSCFEKIELETNRGTITETYSNNDEGNAKWIIPLDELNEIDLVIKAMAYDKAGNKRTVSKTVPSSKLTMNVIPGDAGIVTPAAGDYYYPSSAIIDISATPNKEYNFDEWTVTAGLVEDPNAPDTVFTMPDQNATITANFTPVWKGFTENYSILQQTDNVSVNKPPGVETGDMIIVVLHTNNRIDDKWVNDPSSSQGFSIIGHSTDESDYERPTVSAAYKIAGENEPASYSFEISEEMHWYISAVSVDKIGKIGNVITKDSGVNSVESVTFDSLSITNKSLIIASITQRRSTDSDYNARSIIPPHGMKERYSYYSFESFGVDGKPNASGASRFMEPGQFIESPTYSWDYTGRAAGIMFEIILND
jgi:hypothetical protein